MCEGFRVVRWNDHNRERAGGSEPMLLFQRAADGFSVLALSAGSAEVLRARGSDTSTRMWCETNEHVNIETSQF